MSSYYTEHNGLAYAWDRDYTRIELAKWAYHNPEDIKYILEDFMNNYNHDEPQIILEPMSNEDIDNITGVHLNG